MKVVLVPGLWLGAEVWDEVVAELEGMGHTAVALTLPGQGDGREGATLQDQVDAVVTAVDQLSAAPQDPATADAGVVVVGHSAASSLAWLATDARPEQICAVVFVGGFPSADGEQYAAFLDPVDGVVAFPGWEPFEGPDSADLDAAARAAFEAGAHAVPEAVTHATVHLRDERRYEVPAYLLCPEFSPDEARAWLAAGDLPELARVERLELLDLDSGHWPMLTAPEQLARLIAGVAGPAGS